MEVSIDEDGKCGTWIILVTSDGKYHTIEDLQDAMGCLLSCSCWKQSVNSKNLLPTATLFYIEDMKQHQLEKAFLNSLGLSLTQRVQRWDVHVFEEDTRSLSRSTSMFSASKSEKDELITSGRATRGAKWKHIRSLSGFSEPPAEYDPKNYFGSSHFSVL